jgi:hypothetical protein
MLDEHGHGFEVPDNHFIGGTDLITAILPHPIHGRLVERILLMVTANLTMQGMRYGLSWRDGALAFYKPIPAH